MCIYKFDFSFFFYQQPPLFSIEEDDEEEVKAKEPEKKKKEKFLHTKRVVVREINNKTLAESGRFNRVRRNCKEEESEQRFSSNLSKARYTDIHKKNSLTFICFTLFFQTPLFSVAEEDDEEVKQKNPKKKKKKEKKILAHKMRGRERNQ
ncbi:hypothetical protein CEXT_794271 [Caerostris extrusa]|uniref:Uncharacterized protein n=1 Tax=Caerostris extrusa TaxID=172846 RepID=A0AAV4SN49_CAEEX|nr:hypothetical protein CEXT_794271 [Caerostris extrusa]